MALRAQGDELRAGLRRTAAAADKQSALWRWLVLRGAPAHLDAGDAGLDCSRLQVLAGPDGGIGLVTASGAPALAMAPAAGERSLLRAEHRIHMWPLAEALHAWTGPLGFPRGALGPRFGSILSFAGRSTVEATTANGTIGSTASRGLLLLRADRGSATSLRGTGEVSATLPDGGGTLHGADGLLLHDAGGAAGRARLLTLGRGAAPVTHFALRRGDAFALEGHGRCTVQQTTAAASTDAAIAVASPAQDAVVTVPEGTLRAVGVLRAELRAGAVTSLDATGVACRFEARLADGSVHGAATRIHSDDGRSFRLHGAARHGSALRRRVLAPFGLTAWWAVIEPARVVAEGRGEVFGDVVDLVRRGAQQVVRAHGRAGVRARAARPDGTVLGIALDGDNAELLPTLAPERALRWHASFLPGAARAVFAASWRAPHVHVRGAARFAVHDPVDPAARHRGAGDELWLSLAGDGGHGVLLGRPAQVHVAEKDQVAHGSAERITFAQAQGTLLVTLIPAPGQESTMRVAAAARQGAAAGGLALRDVTVHCRGAIDIEQKQIAYRGPVRVVGEEAADRPPGLTVRADGMVMPRDATGAVTDVIASGHVDLASPRVRGSADVLRLDLRHAIAELSSQRGLATLEVDAARITGGHVELDYTTYAWRVWYGDAGPAQEAR